MSKEEKIEILKRIIENFKSHIEEYEGLLLDVDLYRQLTYQLSIFERELKFLLLPKRTIDTLEVGDWVEVKWINEHYGDSNTIKGTVTDVVKFDNQQFNWFCVNGDIDDEIKFNEVTTLKIIPHEAIELLKDLYQKQNI